MADDDQHAFAERMATALDAEQARTEARIAALTRDLDDIIERSADAVRDDEHDPEGATIAFERAQVTALLRDARAKLAEVTRSRERLERGEHLLCEACDGEIPAERLLARPTTQRCVRCAGR